MTLIDILTNFMWSNCTYLYNEDKKEHLYEEISKDLACNRIVWTTDKQGITGVCRFSIYGDITRILDIAIREDKRGTGVLQKLLRFGLIMYPSVKTLKFNSIEKKREFTIPASLILKKER